MQKQTVIFEENPKWRIYKGKFFCQIGPLSRDRAHILYLIILWFQTMNPFFYTMNEAQNNGKELIYFGD